MKILLKKSCSLSWMVVGFALVIVLLMFQMNLTAIFRQHTTSLKRSQETRRVSQKSMSQQAPQNQPSHGPLAIETMIKCERSHKYYDVCSMNSPTVFDPMESTFYLMDTTNENETNVIVEKIKPYPRKWAGSVMTRIKEVTLAAGSPNPLCLVHHNIPALVFNAGGYTGNFFHEFNEGFIPLFITVNSMFRNQEFVMVISALQDWWVSKYGDLLSTFSKHPIIDLDHEPVTQCFPSVTIGLTSHGLMTVDPKLMPNSETIKDFRALLEITYSRNTTYIAKPHKHRPTLLVITRGGSDGRAILNQHEVEVVANKTGFRVIIFQPNANESLVNSYALLNSSHAMVGVHGAALTHFLFLRPGAVFIQIVPIGPEDVADLYFGKPARDMGLEYLEYKIDVRESSLIEKYDGNSIVMKNPKAIREKGWSKDFVNLYMKEQNVRLDLVRFSKYLKNAYKKAKRFMRKNG